MVVRHLVVGTLQACCYVVGCPRTKRAMIIDPGGDAPKIISAADEAELTPVWIVNTHGHADHMAANAHLKQRYPEAAICIHPGDATMLTDPEENLSAMLGNPLCSPGADRLLAEGEELQVGDTSWRVMHVPGHTPGGICLLGKGVIFVGDTLFAGSIGRWDFPGGDYGLLIRGIREKLLALPPETVVYPGHGPATTVGDEKSCNPFFL